MGRHAFPEVRNSVARAYGPAPWSCAVVGFLWTWRVWARRSSLGGLAARGQAGRAAARGVARALTWPAGRSDGLVRQAHAHGRVAAAVSPGGWLRHSPDARLQRVDARPASPPAGL